MKAWKKICVTTLTRSETWVFLAASVFLLLFFISEMRVHLLPDIFPRAAVFRVFLLCLICALYYLGGLLCRERHGETRAIRVLMVFFAILYLYMLVNLTLLDKSMGRTHLVGDVTENAREYYLREFVNLRPFQSIYKVYILGFLKGYVNAYYMVLNLLGNICVFMPLAFFLPTFFRAQQRWYVFLPTVTLSVALVEALQFTFMVGSCDIDDLILNVSGAMLFYFLLKIPPIRRAADLLAGKEVKK